MPESCFSLWLLFPFLISNKIDWMCQRRCHLHFNDNFPGLLGFSVSIDETSHKVSVKK